MPATPTAPLFVLSFQDHLVATNAHTGERAWTFELPSRDHKAGRLLVAEDRVFFAMRNALVCVDYATGARQWVTTPPGALGVRPNMIYFAGCVVLAHRGHAASFDIRDGRCLWHQEFEGFGTYGGAMAALGTASQVDT